MNLTNFNAISILSGYPPVTIVDWMKAEEWFQARLAELDDYRLHEQSPNRWFQGYAPGVN